MSTTKTLSYGTIQDLCYSFLEKKVEKLFASSFVFFFFVDGGAFSEGDLMKSFFAQVDSDATSLYHT